MFMELAPAPFRSAIAKLHAIRRKRHANIPSGPLTATCFSVSSQRSNHRICSLLFEEPAHTTDPGELLARLPGSTPTRARRNQSSPFVPIHLNHLEGANAKKKLVNVCDAMNLSFCRCHGSSGIFAALYRLFDKIFVHHLELAFLYLASISENVSFIFMDKKFIL